MTTPPLKGAASQTMSDFEKAHMEEIKKQLIEMEFALREISTELKRLRTELEGLHWLVIGKGGPDTLMAKVNSLVSAEESRRNEESELKKMRRNLMVSVTIIICSSLLGIIWSLAKLLH